MVNPIEQLSQTLHLLELEKAEDQRQHQEKMMQNSIAARRKTGYTWYPIVIKDSYYGAGERLIIEVERPTHQEVENLFQHGNVARLFSNYHNEGIENPSLAGVIIASRKDFLKLTFFSDELPDWTATGKLGIDLMFDETSYKEMELAMKRVINAKNNRLAALRDTILGEPLPTFRNQPAIKSDKLNPSQSKALESALNANDIAIIHGPPGTGKTTTLIDCICQTLLTEKQVLVCAPSNAAVDLLTLSLASQGVSVLRIGNISRIDGTLTHHTLDYQISIHPQAKEIKTLKKRAAEFRNLASKYKRNFGKEERAQRKAIAEEAKKLHAEADKIETFITQQILESTGVITSTLVGSSFYLIRDKQFTTVFIDEAGQALEPACWIPITRADRVVMAGDHFQLPPTVKYQEAAKGGLSKTLMEKCASKQDASVMLNTQYRMNEVIMNFSNEKFYRGELKASPTVSSRALTGLDGSSQPPLVFIDTAGCSYEENQAGEGTSVVNPEEGNLLMLYLNQLADKVELMPLSIGIISPYKGQVNYLKEQLALHPAMKALQNLSVNTVDAFQGQERDLICISLVRSNQEKQIGFLSDTRRMNVAMTRAKKMLVIIGDSSTIAADPFYADLVRYVEAHDAYHSAWEYIQP